MLDPSKLRMMEVFNHRIYKIFQVQIPSQIPRRFPRGFPGRFPRTLIKPQEHEEIAI